MIGLPDLQPHVEARAYIRAHANVRGQPHDVIVLGCRGERVFLTWWTDMRRHIGWVPAADVERRDQLPQHAPASTVAGSSRRPARIEFLERPPRRLPLL